MRRNWDGSEWTGGENNWYTDWSEENLESGRQAMRRTMDKRYRAKRGECVDAIRKHAGLPLKEIVGLTGLSYKGLASASQRLGTKHPRQKRARPIEELVKENLFKTNREIADIGGYSESHVSHTRMEMSRKMEPVPVCLVLRDYSVPMECVTLPYRFMGEWVVDLRGQAGTHFEVPVTSLAPVAESQQKSA